MAAWDTFKTDLRAYFAAVDTFVASVDATVAAAIAKDDADEDVDITAVAGEIAAAKAKLPTPPVTPSTNP